MIPYDIDPSLHSGQPEPEQLDDGFSPPRHEGPRDAHLDAAAADRLSEKSPF